MDQPTELSVAEAAEVAALAAAKELDDAVAASLEQVDTLATKLNNVAENTVATRVYHTYNQHGTIMSGVEVTLADGTVQVSDSEGHLTMPVDAEYTCNAGAVCQ